MAVNDTYKIEKELIQSGNAYGYEKTSNNIEITSSNEKVGTVGTDEVFTAKSVGYTIINIEDKTNNIRTAIKVSVEPYKGKATPSINSAVSGTYALKADGTVWAFGYNPEGRLGVGDAVDKTKETPVLSPSGKGILKDVKQLEAGYSSASALLMDGTVVSWGHGDNYTLGHGSINKATIPSYVITQDGEKLTDIVKIARSHYTGLALKSDGTVWAWGYNAYGQLGQAGTTNSAFAVQVKDTTGKGYLTDIIDISLANNTSYAITAGGEVWAWGYNTNGEVRN